MLVFPCFRKDAPTDFTPAEYERYRFSHMQSIYEWKVIDQHGDRERITPAYRDAIKYLSPDYTIDYEQLTPNSKEWVSHWQKFNQNGPLIIDVEKEAPILYERIARFHNKVLPGVNFGFWGYAPTPLQTNRIWFGLLFDDWGYRRRAEIVDVLEDEKRVAKRVDYCQLALYGHRWKGKYKFEEYARAFESWLREGTYLLKHLYGRHVYACISPQPEHKKYYREHQLIDGDNYYNQDIWEMMCRVVQEAHRDKVIQGCICWLFGKEGFNHLSPWLLTLKKLANNQDI